MVRLPKLQPRRWLGEGRGGGRFGEGLEGRCAWLAARRVAASVPGRVLREASEVADPGSLAVIVADTHIPRRAGALPAELLGYLKRADLILHAGDLMDPSLLEELSDYGPVRAVRGNLDPPEANLPETLEFEFAGVRVAMIHDSGPKRGRRNRMKRRFPGARVVVFGHSHIPFLEDEDGLLLLNPGSPTDRRRQPEHTFALLRADDGSVRAEIVPV